MPKLYPTDQEKVNAYIEKEGDGAERYPFRPWTLLLIVIVVLSLLTAVSFYVASDHGVV